MAKINELTEVDVLQSSDQFPLYDASNGASRKVSLNNIADYMQDNLAFQATVDFETQFETVGVTGFSVNVTDDNGKNVHLMLDLTTSFGAGTIVLPALANLIDKQEIIVTLDNAVTTFTITPNGATLGVGIPTTIGATLFFRLKYHAALQTWYRIG